ncbi:MAG: cell division protein ZapA [bacterium]
MAPDSDIIQVEILGVRLQLRGGDDPERVMQVAEYVREKVHDLAERAPTAPTIQLALLTAINIADDLYQMQEYKGPPPEVWNEVLEKAHQILEKTNKV